MAKQNKITVATLKSFINRHANNGVEIFVKKLSEFDGMTDCVESVRKPKFELSTKEDVSTNNTLGISGVWVVGRDRVEAYKDAIYIGYRYYNCCGSAIVAVKKNAYIEVAKKEPKAPKCYVVCFLPGNEVLVKGNRSYYSFNEHGEVYKWATNRAEVKLAQRHFEEQTNYKFSSINPVFEIARLKRQVNKAIECGMDTQSANSKIYQIIQDEQLQ